MSRPYFAPKQIYTGTGSLASYTFDFKIDDISQILIVVVNNSFVEVQRVRGDDTTFLTSVTINTAGEDPSGGVVLLAANLPAGYKMAIIQADDSPIQEYEFRNKTSFTMRRFEDALDAIVGFVQSLVLRTKQSFRINDIDDENAFDAQLPAGVEDQAGRVLAINLAANGVMYGPTTEEIGLAAQAAEDAINAAAEAEASADIAEDGADQASLILFDGEVTISDSDSPVNFDNNTFRNKIVRVNAENGDVIINLNPLVAYPEGFKSQFIRSDSEPTTTVTIVPDGAETIDGMPNYILPIGTAAILSADLTNPTNWVKKFLGITSGGGSIPAGGSDGDYFEILGGAPAFTSGIFTGFSSRYGQFVNLPSLRDALLYVFNFSYVAPGISLSCSPGQQVREKGDTIGSVNMSATTTKLLNNITGVTHYRNGVLVNTEASPIATGGVETYTDNTPFSDTMTFFSRVTDGTGTTQSNTVTYPYVYPYYTGAGAPARTAAQVAAMTKLIINSTASLNRAFTTVNGDVYYFAYPASYGVLTSIKDVNNFESIGGWTRRTENITGLNGVAVSYYIYEFNNPVIAGSTSYTFIR